MFWVCLPEATDFGNPSGAPRQASVEAEARRAGADEVIPLPDAAPEAGRNLRPTWGLVNGGTQKSRVNDGWYGGFHTWKNEDGFF